MLAAWLKGEKPKPTESAVEGASESMEATQKDEFCKLFTGYKQKGEASQKRKVADEESDYEEESTKARIKKVKKNATGQKTAAGQHAKGGGKASIATWFQKAARPTGAQHETQAQGLCSRSSNSNTLSSAKKAPVEEKEPTKSVQEDNTPRKESAENETLQTVATKTQPGPVKKLNLAAKFQNPKAKQKQQKNKPSAGPRKCRMRVPTGSGAEEEDEPMEIDVTKPEKVKGVVVSPMSPEVPELKSDDSPEKAPAPVNDSQQRAVENHEPQSPTVDHVQNCTDQSNENVAGVGAEEGEKSDSDDERCEENDYELMRQRRIEENRRMMAQLGLLAAAHAVGNQGKTEAPAKKEKPKPKPKPKQKVPEEYMVTRRSNRISAKALGGEAVNMSEDALVAAALAAARADHAAAAAAESESEEELEVGQVIPCVPSAKGLASTNTSCGVPRTQLLSGHTHAIYSMSLAPTGTVLAAGGGEGRVTFFPFMPESSDYPKTVAAHGTAKIHSRWISHIKYIGQTQDYGDLLLSASDDCTLTLTGIKSASDGVVVVPRVRLGPNKLHARGVFGMDEMDGWVATCSKDGAVGVSHLANDSLQVVSVYDDVHSGVAKTVRWQPGQAGQPSVVLSGGNDMLINIFDVREGAVVKSLEGRHSQAVNCILFNPSESNQFITASFDKTIVGHDMRNLDTPLFTLAGHHGPGVAKASLTSPVYHDNGRQVVTSGDKSNDLHAYSTATGTLSKRMYVGFTASCLASVPGTSQLVAAYGKQHVWRFMDGM